MTHEEATLAKDMATSMIQAAVNSRVAIIKKHGQGVRPSWVSTDLAYEDMKIQKWQAVLDEAESVLG